MVDRRAKDIRIVRGKRRGLSVDVRKRSYGGTINCVRDYSPESPDWYAIVDFRYILHLFHEWNGHEWNGIKVFDADGTTPNGPHSGRYIQWYKEEVDPDFLSLDERLSHDHKGPKGTFNAYGFVIAEPEKAKPFFDRCTTPKPPATRDASVFFRRLFRRFRRDRINQTPVVYDEKSEHVKLQDAFNAQTNQTSSWHQELEAIIANDPTNQEAESRLVELRRKILFDMKLYDRLKQEVGFFEAIYRRTGIILIREEFTTVDLEFFNFYDYVAEQKRTSFNLFRTIFLGLMTKALLEAYQAYARCFRDEHSEIRERYATLYLKSINVRRELENFINLDHAEFLRMLSHEDTPSLDKVVANYQELFDKHFFTASAQSFKERYQQAIATTNTHYLLEALDNPDEFKQRLKISERYGEVRDPASVRTFHDKYLASQSEEKPLKKFVDSKRVSSWVAFEQQVEEQRYSLDTFLAVDRSHQQRIADLINTNGGETIAQAVILFEFVQIYQEIRGLVGDLRRFPSLNLPQPHDLIESRDYPSMAGYLDIAVTVEAERERLALFSKLQKPRSQKTDPDNDTIRLLFMDRFDYVKPHEKDIRGIRARFERAGNPQGYMAFVNALLEARNNTERDEITSRYASEKDVFFEPPKAEEKRPSPEVVPSSARPSINHLVIVGGYLGHDYQRKLCAAYDIERLTVLPPKSKRRLQQVGRDANFVVITDHVSHQDTAYLEANIPREQWAYSSSSGTSNLLAAIRRITN